MYRYFSTRECVAGTQHEIADEASVAVNDHEIKNFLTR
jgi:hypothetical protein